jgi:glycosyltransferase involved in cell wall biosynthesis
MDHDAKLNQIESAAAGRPVDRRRVALVASYLAMGGLETFLYSLAQGLASRGWEPHIYVTELLGSMFQHAREQGHPVEEKLPHWWQSRTSHAREMADFLAGFDVVVLNHTRAAHAAAGLLPATTGVVAVLHNDADEVYDLGTSGHEEIDRIVCVSPKVLQTALSHGVPKNKAIQICYGVNVPDEWPKAQNSTPAGAPLRGIFLGRIYHPQKGVLDLPEICEKALALGCRFTLDIVGSGDDMTVLQTQMRQRCPQLNVTYHGSLPHERAMAVLAGSDVLVMPSRHEGLPIVLLESLARGVVPLVSHLSGITDWAVTNGEQGLLMPVGDNDAFARGLLRVSDAETLANMSRRAWETAAEKFSVRRMCHDYVALFDDLLAHPRTQPRSGRLNSYALGRFPRWPTFLRRVAVASSRRMHAWRAKR